MSFCTKCGRELEPGSKFCSYCGASNDSYSNKAAYHGVRHGECASAAKILLIIITAFTAIFILPLIIMLPITITYSNRLKNNEHVGLGLKIIVLIFVSRLVGILMLCDNER